jgi:hypothetical protein
MTPSRAAAKERARVLRGPDGVLWARYERMHAAMYDRAHKELKQAEKEAAEGDAPDSSATRCSTRSG